MGLNVLAMEYCGYGLYSDDESNENNIKRDSKSLIGYIVDELNFHPSKIILCGRSIGCHFAISLAKYFPVHSLILIAPFSSIKQFVRDWFGKLCEILIRDSMSNICLAKFITCPTLIIHGELD